MKTKNLSFLVLLFLFSLTLHSVSGQTYFRGGLRDDFRVNSIPTEHDNAMNSGNDTLGVAYNNSICGLGYVQGSVLTQRRTVAAGFNTNGSGFPSTIFISGISANAMVEKAYLWYTASYTESAAPASSVSITNPSLNTNSFNSVLIGTDGVKCWGEKGSAAYRTDVTSNIQGNGNYLFDLTGFVNDTTEVDGATLLIIFRDTTATYEGSLIIWDGIVASGSFNAYLSPRTATINGFNVCANASYADAFMIVSDMQANVNSGNHLTQLNGATASYPNLFWNFDKANTVVTKGQTTSSFYADGFGQDCFAICAAGLYYRTDSCVLCSNVLSANNINTAKFNLVIYPNPTHDEITVALNTYQNLTTFHLLDLTGRIVMTKNLSGNEREVSIDVHDLSAGVYVVSVEGENFSEKAKVVIE